MNGVENNVKQSMSTGRQQLTIILNDELKSYKLINCNTMENSGSSNRDIVPFNGGNLTNSRLSLMLNVELCLFSFLMIEGPFAKCRSFTTWLGG